jgi:two-component system phosphate regulon sensor histidine kinase PhoR
LNVDIQPELPPVRIDENAMTLVLMNLVDNAMKYGPESGAIGVTLRRAGEHVVLSVSDEGPGIRPEEQKKIFERFYRAKQTRGRPVRGSGIGLALVQHIVDAHGGRVTVQSDMGQGSVFSVFLPLGGAKEAPAVAAHVS